MQKTTRPPRPRSHRLRTLRSGTGAGSRRGPARPAGTDPSGVWQQPAPTQPDCHHHPVRAAGLEVMACCTCGRVDYRDQRGPVSPTVALARLFGDFDLVAELPALHAPDVLLYRPPNRTRRQHLDAFPPRHWFEVDQGLWLSHDGDHLMLATARPVHVGPGGA